MSDPEREDVEELTQELRTSHERVFRDLRDDLARAGHDVSRLVLAVFLETEDCEEDGALITPEERVLLFIRAPVPQHLHRKRFIVFRDITDEPAAIDKARGQIEIGLKMVREASGSNIA